MKVNQNYQPAKGNLFEWIVCMAISLLSLISTITYSQTCPAPVVPAGDLVNVISNPGFETGVIAPGNTGPHTLLPAANSSPGTYMINGSSNLFNVGMIGGITPHSGTKMLMIDGVMAVNATAWEQTVTVQTGKTYYFSAWLTSLSAVEQSQMVFQVQPVLPVAGPSIDISPSFIPVNGPAWNQEFGSWYSGTTTQVKVRLVNKNPDAVGGQGNDYAIDDIVFRPTCVGTKAGPKPTFDGSTIGICNNGGSVDLNSNVSNSVNHTYTWFRDATLVPNVTTPNILEAQTIPGTYKVCIDSAGCVNSGTVVLQSSLVLDFGPDLNLCNPAYTLLDTRITNASSFTITWYKNSVLIPGATGTTYMATGAGTYKVNVTNGAGCTGTAQIVTTSQAEATVNATYCAPASTATVSVVNSGGTYKWYNVATGGTSLGSGLTYTATGLTAAGSPYTFYVENTKAVTSVGGMLNDTDPALGTRSYGTNNVHAQNFVAFTANVNTTLTQATVLLDMNANYAGNVTITLEDVTLGTTAVSTSPVSNNPGTAGTKSYTIPLSLSLIAGHNYRLSIVGVNGFSFAHRYDNVSGYYPKAYTAVTMTGGQAPSIYPGIFDWRFSSATTCDRTPATITNTCSLPITLLDFTANFLGPKTVGLQWITTAEVNNDYFTIQRSLDGIHFTSIGIVKGAGNSSGMTKYTFEDPNAFDGLSYYRLLQADFDGTVTYSKVVAVNDSNLDSSLEIFPNPIAVGGLLIIHARGLEASAEIPVSLYDVLGRMVYSKNILSDARGNINQEIESVGQLKQGTYIITIPTANQQLLKQKLIIF